MNVPLFGKKIKRILPLIVVMELRHPLLTLTEMTLSWTRKGQHKFAKKICV
jgi:hypothetical protein